MAETRGEQHPERGAALLLAIYLSALTLLLLNAVGLQRSTAEMRSATMANSQAQSFYLAEAGLDQALHDLRAAADMASVPVASSPTTTVLGSYQYTLEPQGVMPMDLSQSALQLLYQVTATGQASNRPPQVLTAFVAVSEHFTGATAQGGLDVFPDDGVDGNGFEHPIRIQGTLANRSGKKLEVRLKPGVTLRGDIFVNQPAAEDGYQELWAQGGPTSDGTFPGYALQHAAVLLYGARVPPAAGYRADNTRLPAAEIEQGEVRARTMPATLPAAAAPEQCQGDPWMLSAETTYHLRDGDPMDQSPAGDGQVIVCVPYLMLDEMAQLIVHQPTAIYLTSGDQNDPWGLGHNPHRWGRAFMNEGEVKVMGSAQGRDDRGLRLVVTTPADKKTDMVLGRFEGSVYAPHSWIFQEANAVDRARGHLAKRFYGFLVGEKIWLGTSADFREPDEGQTGITPALVSWNAP